MNWACNPQVLGSNPTKSHFGRQEEHPVTIAPVSQNYNPAGLTDRLLAEHELDKKKIIDRECIIVFNSFALSNNS